MYTVENKVKENIFKTFTRELDNRGYEYSDDAVNKIIDNCFTAKQNLLELLSRHPLWNEEKLMIAFDQDYDRKLELEELHMFCNYLLDKVAAQRVGELETLGIDANENLRRKNIISWIRYNIREQFFNDTMSAEVERINTYNDYKLRTNEKSSKAIGKICRKEGWDKLEGYGTRYAALCDNLNPIKVKRHTVISLNPIDFLLMSNGDTWQSCHYIGNYSDDAGCYSSGTISYMLDDCSFIFYTVDGSYNGNDIERAKKAQRQVFGYDDEVFIQSRLYPQGNDCGAEHIYTDIRNIVQKILADCLDKPNLWTISRDIDTINDIVKHGNGATCYPDWHNGNPGSDHCCLSTLKSRTNGKDFRKITLGAKPICVTCGCKHDVEDNISCCTSGYTCYECGCYIGNDVYWVGDDPYCYDCVSYCDRCGCYENKNDGEWVGDYWYCNDCLEVVANRCDECGEYILREDSHDTEEGNTYCSDCFSEEAFECAECGEFHDKNYGNFDEITENWYCYSCYDELLEEREEEENEDENEEEE